MNLSLIKESNNLEHQYDYDYNKGSLSYCKFTSTETLANKAIVKKVDKNVEKPEF